ncbi:hypothetical protein [Klenkia sp. PcliD-1-E]|uniref:FitA-like ribbon-helix-helix domain-containing protein n=1 Tax=Klenkia sp. PcliD-1-E TaxID=2954492 RepID=UPI00209742E9|nr:hypothetical protein [Klenkia sp. PcliD-1-E]MCO7219416.1 hypothetical protein [Klenkia sp. PcliD-1-E]
MLQVRNVPDDVHARLQERASAAGMSLSEYTLRELSKVAARPTQEEVFRRAEALGLSATFEETLAALDEGRAER